MYSSSSIKKFFDIYFKIFPGLWPLDTVGEKQFEIFKNWKIFFQKVQIIILFLTLLCAICGFPWFGDEDEFYLTIKFYLAYVNKWTTLFYIIFYSFFIHIALTFASCALCFIYFVLHLYIQCVMLNERLKALDSEKDNQLEKIDDQEYQNFVTRELKFCIKQHQNVLK